MIAKTLSGVSVLDESYGGVFSNRSFLVCGAKNSGKTIFGLRFIQQGLEQNERCLYLSTMAANDLSICAAALGFDLTPAIDASDLTLLEYESFIHGNGAPGLDMLPPEGFDQLRDIIHANSIERVVLDTVLPWVSVKEPDRMAEQIFSFTRSFDRLGVTTMLTLPKPVSSMAFRLKKSIEDVVPISILLQPEDENQPAAFQVVKYLGEKKLGGKVSYNIGNGKKVDPNARKPVPEPESKPATPPASKPPVEFNQQPRPRFSAGRKDPEAETHRPPQVPPRDLHEGNSPSSAPRSTDSEQMSSRPPLEDASASPRSEPVRDFPAPEPRTARLSTIWKPYSPSEEPQQRY